MNPRRERVHGAGKEAEPRERPSGGSRSRLGSGAWVAMTLGSGKEVRLLCNRQAGTEGGKSRDNVPTGFTISVPPEIRRMEQ